MLLQKIIVVIVGLVMSVVGALSPDMFAGKNAGSSEAELAANTAEETLATLRTSNGEAFARVSVLWVEVDGRRVTEDAWGTGEVEELRFKVGVKGIDDVALAVGEKVVPMHPTDIITIRMFRGDFSYRGVGTPLASVQLQGTVKTTVLHQGDLANRVMTRVNELDLGQPTTKPGDEEKVAYVVLTTGQKVDTVAVEDGGARLFTEEVATASEAKNEPGNLLAKWVKVDDKLIREYTWGDGTLQKIEFEPAEAVSRSIVLAFNGETFEVAAGERVVVEDFVGEYLIYQVSGGMMRVRLDGYARAYLTAPALPVPSQGGPGAPLASFDFAPANPKTTDTVQFRDRSTDDGGIIVFRAWDFGDNSSGILPDPTHRFTKPGTYQVRLNVTDNDLKTSNVTRTVVVRNSEPVADFDFSPKIVNTDTVVAFSDHSYDADGTLAHWSWSFGDGESASTRHPTHRFTRAGNVTVTLTVTDEMGGKSSLSKVILVRNAPPLASFTYSPGAPMTLDPVQFLDNSTDRDGRITAWNWSFGDGRYGAGSAPVHAYARPGLYTVTLTVYDDMGDADTASTTLAVGNRPPFADFSWTPEGAPAGAPVTFTSQSSDPDGIILFSRWRFGDGTQEATGAVATHAFPRAGTYNVTLSVTDNTLGVSEVVRSVTIANTAPRASMIFAPNPTYRGTEVVFSDTSTDPDGDPVVNTTWDFGDGAIAFGRVATHSYSAVGTFPVTVLVRDSNGHESSITRSVRVLNRPPVITAEFAPQKVHAGDTVTFSASGVDPDLAGGTVSFVWNFSDGVEQSGPVVTRNFTKRGNYTVTVRGHDTEGGVSAPVILGIGVDYARPLVDFTWDPLVPIKGQLVNFSDRSFSINGPLRDWRWTFGDDTGVATLPHPSHVFAKNGSFKVRLQVTDIAGQTNLTEKTIFVNLRPQANFVVPDEVIQIGSPVTFVDTSFDEDGTVDNWTWTFGDGTVSYERHPTHPGYSSPGSYPVKLTIRDDHGAANQTTRFVDIANAPPVARWSYDTLGQPLKVNNTVLFDGSASSDPDGNPILSHEWTMGDGTVGKSGETVSHIYKRSGRWTVGLTVTDGSKTSLRTEESHKQLVVRPDHPVKFIISAYLPDNKPAPITVSPYSVSLRVGGQILDGSQFLPVGDSYEVMVEPTLWVHGDAAVVRVQAPFLAGPSDHTTVLKDGLHVVHVNFTLRLAVTAELTPAPGQRVSFLALLGASPDHNGDPLYSDMTERPHGTGALTYADGEPAGGMRADIEARWVPLRYLSDARNQTSGAPVAALPNWCKVGSAVTAENGTFSWTFDGDSQCYANGLGDGAYPAGRWEVRARPQVPTAENRVSPIRAFYVDPTGGLLLMATMGLA